MNTKFKKGRIPWNKGKTGLQKAWNKGLTAKTDEIIGEMNKKAVISRKINNKMSLLKGKTYEEIYGPEKGEEMRLKHSGNGNGMYNKHLSEKSRKLLSEKHKKLWENPEHAKIHIGFGKPNKLEIKLDKILQDNFPGEWKYVGNGEVIIGRKNPDFININGKKQVIELYGTYWHKNHVPQDRIDHFKKHGFDCIILWDRELKDINYIVERIKHGYPADALEGVDLVP